MGLSDAERARRSRRHRAGDHTLCDPERCDEAVTVESRGQRLYRQVSEGADLSPGQLVLLEEAARIADRLDRLDAQLDDGEWLRVQVSPATGDIVVMVDKVLGEARQQATALKQIIAELRQSGPASKSARATAGATAGARSGTGGGSGIADLTQRIAATRGSTA